MPQARTEEQAVQILLAEQNGTLLEEMARAVQARIPNAQLRRAANAVEALTSLGRFAPKLAVLDAAMPNVDASALLALIRNDEWYAKLRLIVWAHPGEDGPLAAAMRRAGVPVTEDKPDTAALAEAAAREAASPHAMELAAPPDEPVEEDEPAIFDLAMALENSDGDIELLDTLMEMALELVPEELAKLRKAVEKQCPEEADLHAHTLKGQAMSFGSEALRRVAYRAEMAAKNGDMATVNDVLPSLENLVTLFREALRESI